VATKSPSRSGLVTGFKISAHATTLLVLVQAVLAGVFISGEEHDAVDVHEIMSNVILPVVAVQLVLAFLVRGEGRFQLVYWVALLFVLSVAQIGLGYGSREDTLWEAIHIPLGVLIFGLALVISTLAVLDERPREPGA